MTYTASVGGFITVYENRNITVEASSDAEAAELMAREFARQMHEDYPSSQDYGTLYCECMDGKHLEICADGY